MRSEPEAHSLWSLRSERSERLEGPRRALDVEFRGTPPAHLLARLPSGMDFWHEWTRLEVVAKLTDTPVLTLLGRGALGGPIPPQVAIETIDFDGFTASFGWRVE